MEHHARALALPLKDVEVRKVASGLTTLANEKQKEQRDKASGKKKAKGSSKPPLAGAKVLSRLVSDIMNLKVICLSFHLGDKIRVSTMRRWTTLVPTMTTSCEASTVDNKMLNLYWRHIAIRHLVTTVSTYL